MSFQEEEEEEEEDDDGDDETFTEERHFPLGVVVTSSEDADKKDKIYGR
jgi:hypothetical protein